MKRIIIAFSIITLSVSIGIFSLFFIKNTCTKAVSGIEEIIEYAATQNSVEVNRSSVYVNRNWKDKYFLMNILIGREYTAEVTKLLDKIVSSAQRSDYETVIADSEECKTELMFIIESNEPKLSTIF